MGISILGIIRAKHQAGRVTPYLYQYFAAEQRDGSAWVSRLLVVMTGHLALAAMARRVFAQSYWALSPLGCISKSGSRALTGLLHT